MDAGPRDPSIALVSIRWERVQLILEARIAAGHGDRSGSPGAGAARRRRGDAADADDRRWRPSDGPVQRHGRTRARAARRGALDPAQPGRRWTTRPPSTPRPPAGVFPLTTGLYTVVPAFTPAPECGAGHGTPRVRRRVRRGRAPRRRGRHQAGPAAGLHQGQASDLQPPRVGLEAARRARPPAGPVHVPAHLGDVGQPPGRQRSDGRARPGPRLRAA